MEFRREMTNILSNNVFILEALPVVVMTLLQALDCYYHLYHHPTSYSNDQERLYTWLESLIDSSILYCNKQVPRVMS